MSKTKRAGFRTERAREDFIRTYDELMAEFWPSATDFTEVRTAFGTTRVQRNGTGDGIPIVLVAPSGGLPLTYSNIIGRLSAAHTVFSPETIAEPGHHLPERPVLDGEDLAAWLVEVLDGLEVERSHLVGMSHGAWVSVRTALRAPERVASVSLLDPPGFEKIGWRFIRWNLACALFLLTPRRVREWGSRWLVNGTLRSEVFRRLLPKLVGFRQVLPLPQLYTEAQLSGLSRPSLVVLGGKSRLNDLDSLRERLAGLPNITRVEVLPEAGHVLSLDEPERVVELVLDFVGAQVH
ncbi:alpha/beta fold hydrolase [Crossiella sp. SN42]|uniref:alpha/beta fold hydrolase n=1 Tax=Crossiella sp. SN42 TaxID=2944808 RepID=UPI00207D6A62|nr:alpha/beta fold hydrolase [Crossiella sp. SN42]MCO1576096.1 alpha/beta fold hydrolase [Crossiella sp. SN42]